MRSSFTLAIIYVCCLLLLAIMQQISMRVTV